MHNAPAVTYPVGRSHFQVLLTSALLLLAVAVLGVWCWLVERPDWRQALVAGIWLACAGLALCGLRWPSLGILRWDGQNWFLESGGMVLTGSVLPRLDWQAGVLLEFSAPSHRVRWLWLEREQQALRWDALRRALWAPGKAAAPLPGLVADGP
jgi:hypothetical protein